MSERGRGVEGGEGWRERESTRRSATGMDTSFKRLHTRGGSKGRVDSDSVHDAFDSKALSWRYQSALEDHVRVGGRRRARGRGQPLQRDVCMQAKAHPSSSSSSSGVSRCLMIVVRD